MKSAISPHKSHFMLRGVRFDKETQAHYMSSIFTAGVIQL